LHQALVDLIKRGDLGFQVFPLGVLRADGSLPLVGVEVEAFG
jgi:hypothetical protein